MIEYVFVERSISRITTSLVPSSIRSNARALARLPPDTVSAAFDARHRCRRRRQAAADNGDESDQHDEAGQVHQVEAARVRHAAAQRPSGDLDESARDAVRHLCQHSADGQPGRQGAEGERPRKRQRRRHDRLHAAESDADVRRAASDIPGSDAPSKVLRSSKVSSVSAGPSSGPAPAEKLRWPARGLGIVWRQ